jgi:hypothetical protein
MHYDVPDFVLAAMDMVIIVAFSAVMIFIGFWVGRKKGSAEEFLLAGRGMIWPLVGFSLIAVALFCFTYVFSQGSRWDWFEEPRILWLTVIGVATLLAFLGQQVLAKGQGLLDFTLFETEDFSFAFIVSFVAGAALFGSAFLIPSFAVSVLAFTPTEAGLLQLPSSALFIAALLLAAYLMQVRRVPPIATVPFGILAIMVAMWMLSGSTIESGTDDMMPAILLRGLGLGLLFLSINLIAFGHYHGWGVNEAGRHQGLRHVEAVEVAPDGDGVLRHDELLHAPLEPRVTRSTSNARVRAAARSSSFARSSTGTRSRYSRRPQTSCR